MFKFMHRRIFLPAFETLIKRRKTLRYLRELERSQWLSVGDLEQLQFEALRLLLVHAVTNCEYYREVWRQQGLDPGRLQAPEDFRAWPVIGCDTILANRMRMRADAPRMRLLSKATGGSSGVPLQFDLNTDSNDRRVAASYRGYGWAGAGPGTKQLHLWGVPLGEQGWMRRCKDRLYHAFHRHRILNCFDLGEGAVCEFLAQHNRYRPQVIVAYTNALYEFARMLEERGLKPFSPGSIVVGAEKLHGFQRQLIERVFGAGVRDVRLSRVHADGGRVRSARGPAPEL